LSCLFGELEGSCHRGGWFFDFVLKVVVVFEFRFEKGSFGILFAFFGLEFKSE
jgi:hypothetical protein